MNTIMNKRIRDFAEQTSLALFDNTAHHRLLPGFAEKFAELIVNECANLNFRSTGFVTGEGEDMVRSMIKKHFGVEE